MDSKYSLIELFLNEGVYEKAIVTYEDGTIKEIIGLDVIDLLNKYADKLGVDLKELLANKSKYSIVEREKEREYIPTVEDTKEEIKEEKEEVVEEHIENHKGKRNIKKNIIKITSLAAALIIGGVIIDGCVVNKKRSSEFNSLKTNKVNTQTTNNEKSLANQNVVVKDDIITINNTTSKEPEDYNHVFLTNLQDETRYNRLPSISKKMLEKDSVSNEEFQYFLNSITILCQSNIAEVEKLVEGGRMGGKRVELYLQNLFDNESYDYFALYDFFTTRNIIVENAYKQNKDMTLSDVNNYLNYFLDFVFNGEGMSFNGELRGFYELSPVARFIIVSLGQSMLEINHNYTHKINGVNCNYEQLINEMYDYFDTVVKKLQNQGGKSK